MLKPRTSVERLCVGNHKSIRFLNQSRTRLSEKGEYPCGGPRPFASLLILPDHTVCFVVSRSNPVSKNQHKLKRENALSIDRFGKSI